MRTALKEKIFTADSLAKAINATPDQAMASLNDGWSKIKTASGFDDLLFWPFQGYDNVFLVNPPLAVAA